MDKYLQCEQNGCIAIAEFIDNNEEELICKDCKARLVEVLHHKMDKDYSRV